MTIQCIKLHYYSSIWGKRIKCNWLNHLNCYFYQCCGGGGSGSKFDLCSAILWIWIRIPNTDLDPHPQKKKNNLMNTFFIIIFSKFIPNATVWKALNPDPKWSKFLDPDSNTMYLDPQHWFKPADAKARKTFVCQFLCRIFPVLSVEILFF